MHHSGVPVVNEDVGAALDGGNRRAGYHLQSHTVVTVHHTVNDLNLQSNSSYLSHGKLQIESTFILVKNPWSQFKDQCFQCLYPRFSSVGVIVQEVAEKCEGLFVRVYKGQREDPSCRVKQGPGVAKAS